jgi:hypothetical protein
MIWLLILVLFIAVLVIIGKKRDHTITLYQSEVTQFINSLKYKDPNLEAKQRYGRALLWDKKIDFEELRDYKASKVPVKPYQYDDLGIKNTDLN